MLAFVIFLQTGYISETQSENAINRFTKEPVACDNKLTQPTRLAEPLKQAEPIPQLIAPQAVAEAKAEKNRLAAIQQHSTERVTQLIAQPKKKEESETRQKAAEVFNTTRPVN